jgi:hypothetical protein
MEDRMASNGAAWTVTSQREDVNLGPNNALAKGVQVTFTTASGITGSVFIPDADYRPDVVRARIAERAAAMEAVHKLTGA